MISCSQGNKPETKEQSKITITKPEEVFTTLKFEIEGKPCVAVINNRFKNFSGKTQYPLSLFITVNTLEKDSNGHPTEKELPVFHDLQSLIIKELNAQIQLCHAGTTTMNGYHDIMLYIPAKDQEKATAVLARIKQDHARLASFTFEEDPSWEAVESFYEAVGSN